MEYIAVAVQDGTLPLARTGEDWRVVASPSPLGVVQLALAHGATPVLRGGEPVHAIHRATRLDLAQPHALLRGCLELGDSLFLLTRGWQALADRAVAVAAWQDGEPTVVLRLAVASVSDYIGVRLIPDRVDILPLCATRLLDARTSLGPIDEVTIIDLPDLPDMTDAFAELQRQCVQALGVEQAFLLDASAAQHRAIAVPEWQMIGEVLETMMVRQGLVLPRPQGRLAEGAMRHADYGMFDEAGHLNPTVLTAYLAELADLPPVETSLTKLVPRTAAPSAPADEWKYAVAAMQDRRWPDSTDPLRAQPPPAPPTAVQLLDWEVGTVSGEGRGLIDFCPSPDPRVREHAVALLDRSGLLLYSAFLPLPAHQITFEGLRWDEPYQVLVNSLDAAGRWSFTSTLCTFTFHSPSAAAIIQCSTEDPSVAHIYIGWPEDHQLVATVTVAEPVPAPPVTAGWWCTDCRAFVLLAAERVGGLCLECGGRETTWREG